MAVRDLEKSKAFYTEILGFKILEQDPEHGGVFLTLGDTGNTLDLFPSDSPDADGDLTKRKHLDGLGVRHTAFGVEREEDLAEAYHALSAAGITVEQALDHESQKSIYFRDPDHNLLEICWERPDARAVFARGRADDDTTISFS